MEQIVKQDGIYRYGDRRCVNVDEAYRLFRDDYHKSLGKAVYHRLDRFGQRKERVHGFGFIYPYFYGIDGEGFEHLHRVRCRLLGMAHISYVWIIGKWDMEQVDDDQYERWMDWALSGTHHRRALVMDNKAASKSGRTNKRLKARYR